MADSRFRKFPRPDEGVVNLLEIALESARKGRIKSVSLIAVDQLNQVETAHAGDLTPPRRDALMGGICRSCVELAMRAIR